MTSAGSLLTFALLCLGTSAAFPLGLSPGTENVLSRQLEYSSGGAFRRMLRTRLNAAVRTHSFGGIAACT